MRAACLPNLRGFTLVETLVAVALLALLAVACAAAVELGIRHTPALRERLEWELAASALLDQIGDDLRAHDVDSTTNAADPCVQIREGTLVVRTRCTTILPDGTPMGFTAVRYSFDRGAAKLDRVPIEPRDARRGIARPERFAPLLAQLTSWSCDLDPEHDLLTVALHGPSDSSATRTYLLP